MKLHTLYRTTGGGVAGRQEISLNHPPAPVRLGICTYFDKMLKTPKVDLN